MFPFPFPWYVQILSLKNDNLLDMCQINNELYVSIRVSFTAVIKITYTRRTEEELLLLIPSHISLSSAVTLPNYSGFSANLRHGQRLVFQFTIRRLIFSIRFAAFNVHLYYQFTESDIYTPLLYDFLCMFFFYINV